MQKLIKDGVEIWVDDDTFERVTGTRSEYAAPGLDWDDYVEICGASGPKEQDAPPFTAQEAKFNNYARKAREKKSRIAAGNRSEMEWQWYKECEAIAQQTNRDIRDVMAEGGEKDYPAYQYPKESGWNGEALAGAIVWSMVFIIPALMTWALISGNIHDPGLKIAIPFLDIFVIVIGGGLTISAFKSAT